MRQLLRYFNRNLLLKVAGFNSIHIVIRIGTGAVMSWVIANFLGTTGMAVMGNFRNFFQGLQSFSVLGMENGLVRYAAQHKSEAAELKSIFSTAWIATLITTLIIGILVFFTATQLDAYLIGLDRSYSFVFRGLAITMPFYVLFTMISTLLQGFEWYKRFVIINIIVNLIVFAASVILITNYLLDGALIAIVVTPVIQCIIAMTIWWRLKKDISLKSLLTGGFSISSFKPLMSYSSMALLSALLIPVTFIAVRQDVRSTLGDVTAGNWEGLQRISGYYMMFVTTLVSLYVLPRLSKDASHQNYRATAFHFYKTILIPVSLGLIAIYLSRDLIVTYLFSEEFTGMLPMFKWQLAGDFVKVVTTVLAFRFIAINDLKRYAIAEVVSLASFYVANYFLIRTYGSEGVVMAHLASYVIYLAVILVMLRKELLTD
ncbi:polysaccharide transporter, PST family [Nonlabens sp. Hel1_33_55]|uniref:O-antigen translocase n=1 Tax=Nonlabens sp. Hel1_33_55 TaxID=1336802 RepID=UPI000875A9D2|nr:O-antigen translocase [Nonlabens sp. Hel1_33_55]SCY20963.1 polysaccharide transporter, PST family [Nonlabens sp. Hel1_33_55]